MFRLTKILGSACTTEENVALTNKNKVNFNTGSAITCTNGTLSATAGDGFPDYIFTGKVNPASQDTVYGYPVTADMIFKVEGGKIEETTLEGRE